MRVIFGASALGLGVALAACGTASGTAASKTSGAARSKTTASHISKVIPVSGGVVSASAPNSGGNMWVLAGSSASKGIFQVSTVSGKTLESVSVSNGATGVAQAPSGLLGIGVDSGNAGSVQFRSGTTGSAVSTVALSGPVVGLASGGNGNDFYALIRVGQAESVAVVDPGQGKVIATVPVSSHALAVVPAPGGSDIYVLSADGFVDDIVVASGQVDGHFPVGHSGYALAITQDGTTLYVLKGQDPARNIAIVDTATESVRKVIPAAAASVAVQLSQSQNSLFDVVGTAHYGNIQAISLS